MKLVLMSVTAGMLLVGFAWIVTGLLDGYRNDQISAREVVKNGVLAVIALSALFSLVALL